MTAIFIRAEVESEQRRELMQMFKTWIASRPLPTACLERRFYEDAVSPTISSLLNSGRTRTQLKGIYHRVVFRALLGAVKVLGTLLDLRLFEAKVIDAA